MKTSKPPKTGQRRERLPNDTLRIKANRYSSRVWVPTNVREREVKVLVWAAYNAGYKAGRRDAK